MKDEALIHILLAKEPWNAGHGEVMKAWQNLMGMVLDMVVDGDKIFQGVSEVMLKKRYQFYLNLGKKWDQEKEKRNQLENKEDRDDLTRSTAQLIHGCIEDLTLIFYCLQQKHQAIDLHLLFLVHPATMD